MPSVLLLVGDRGFIVGSKQEEEVCMREAAFLEFDHIHMYDRLAKDIFGRMSEVFEEKIEFDLEYSGDDIWTVLRSLAIAEDISNLSP